MIQNPIIIITGAAGMIGSGVVRYLNDMGNKSLLLVDDLKSTEKWKNLLGKNFLDLISKHELLNFLKERGSEVGAIIHLGACSDTTELNGDYLLENNYRYTIKLAEWALERGVRFIYASSAATYGDGSCGFVDHEDMIEELRPLNLYGYSKQLVDLWMKRQGAFKQAVGLKYFNVFGPNEYHKGKMSSMVLKMAGKVASDGLIQLFQSNHPDFLDGDQRRDFIYVKDAVKATCDFLLPQYMHVGGLFNIGRGEPGSWNQLASYLFDALEMEKKIQYIPLPQELAKQYQNYTCACMKKWRSTFSSEIPFLSLENAVKEYVQEYLMKSARW